MPADDTELMMRIRAGDDEAFEEFVERHQRRLFRVAYASLGNREEALDATQETFVKMYQARHSWRPEGRPTTWIHRILMNHCIDRMRRSRLRASVPLDELPGSSGWPPADPSGSPHARQEARELREELGRAIDSLPDRQRMVIVLRHASELPLAEIASILGCSTGTVKSSLHRALGRLRRILSERPAAPAREREDVS